MNIQNMHLAFDRIADIVATQGYPGAEPEEKDFYINRAIERFVKTRYTGNNPKGESFGQTQKRVDDLRTLLRRNPVTNGTLTQVGTTGEWHYTFPDGTNDEKYMFYIASDVYIDRDECGNTVTSRKIKIKMMTHDQKAEFLDDPFHTSDYNELLTLIEDDRVYFYTNSLYGVVQFDMTYLTYPDEVSLAGNIDCNLPEHTHQEIVDNAVRLYIVGIADAQRAQIESQVIKEQE